MENQDTITIRIKRQAAQVIAQYTLDLMDKGKVDPADYEALSEHRAVLLFTPNDMKF